MSKSLGNVLLVCDLLDEAPGEAIRFAFARRIIVSHSTGVPTDSFRPSVVSIVFTVCFASLRMYRIWMSIRRICWRPLSRHSKMT